MNGVKLPPALLADLYGDMLVIVGSAASKMESAAEEMIAKINIPQQVNAGPETKPQVTERKPSVEKSVENASAASVLLGRYSKRILVLVNEADYKYCSEEDLQFLQKILQALRLSLNDIGILNLSKHPSTYAALASAYNPAQVLLLGPDASSIALPMRFPQFQVQPWGTVSFIQAPALSKMNGDSTEQVAQKKQLWEGLKRMFS